MEIKCKDCGKMFEVSTEEKTWYEAKGFDIPKRCPECRRTRRRRNKSKEVNHESTEI